MSDLAKARNQIAEHIGPTELASLRERVKELEAKNEKLNLHLQNFVEHVQYIDSYGVPGSDFEACLCCRGGGAPGIPLVHESHCPVGKSLDAYQDWCDEQREFEAESLGNAKRAHAAEARAARLQKERDEVYERCAKVVESFAPETQDMMSTTISDYCDSIAAAIRQLAAGKEKGDGE